MNLIHKIFSSRSSLVGLFSAVCIMLTIPLAILMAQQNQDVRQHAAGTENGAMIVTPTPVLQIPKTGTISGYVFHDDNEDGKRDINEKPYPMATLDIIQIRRDGTVNGKGENASSIAQLKTDANGYFTYFYRYNSQYAYTIKLKLPDNYKTINTNPVYLLNTAGNNQAVVEFGLFPINKITFAPTCTPPPTCLTTSPSCKIAEPAGGWCPIPTKVVTPTPTKTMVQRTPEVHGD